MSSSELSHGPRHLWLQCTERDALVVNWSGVSVFATATSTYELQQSLGMAYIV